jgi:hypothetical protein
MLPPGLSVALGYDDTLDDPISRWGQCLSRVLGCYRASPTAISTCVASMDRCADDTGGQGCCPPACIEQFRANVAAGMAENNAVDASFVEGTCVAGFQRVTP